MNADQSQALFELDKNVKELNLLFTLEKNKDQWLRAYETVLNIRANANLVKSYVLEQLEQQVLEAA